MTNTRKKVVDELNKDKLDGMDDALIQALVDFTGGDDEFIHECTAIAEKGAVAAIDKLDDREQVYNFFSKHKKELLAYIKNSAWRKGGSTILESIMKEVYTSYNYEPNIDIDMIAITVFGEAIELDKLSNADVVVARITVSIAVTEVARNYNEVAMQRKWVARQIQRQKDFVK